MAYFDEYGVEFSDNRKTLVKCPSDFKGEYVVPNSVTRIDPNAFFRCSNLTSILIPDSVSYMGFDAFFDCQSLTSVTMPKGVEDISHGLFYGCKSLNSIEIPHGVTSIGRNAFYYCESLKSVTLPDSVTNIGEGAFAFCKSLVFVNIPNSITSIGEAVFSSCESLKAIKIPDGITCIESHTFNGCCNMASIQIPDNVKRIGESAFSGCKSLTCVAIPPKITRIENFTFCGCSGLTSIKIPEGVTSIGHAAFWACKALTSIEMPSTVTTIINLAFASCETNLQKFVVPCDSVERFCNIEELKPYAEIIRKTAQTAIRDEYEQRLLQEQQRQEFFQDTILFFDTETSGIPRNFKASVSNSANWPRLVQMAWIVTNEEGKILKRRSEIIYPDGFTIPQEATDVHGITTERAKRDGKPLKEVLKDFAKDLANAKQIVCHNVEFDQHIVGAELYRLDMDYKTLMDKPSLCTMLSSTNFCAIPNPNGYDDYKWPKLSELYHKLFNRDFENAHDALADITATKDCFFELKRRGIIRE